MVCTVCYLWTYWRAADLNASLYNLPKMTR